jgi:spore maturation protein CgeB
VKIVMFYHSLLSDWNHGNAHFLRGVASELILRGHDVRVMEPANNWSLSNLLAEHGVWPLERFHEAYPTLRSTSYDPAAVDLNAVLDDADLVIVHEWNDHALVARIGAHRAERGRYTLLFHDTHHRAVTQPDEMSRYDLRHYDGVLAFGDVLRGLYLARRWTRRAWTWHEAADTRLFRPIADLPQEGDLVWVGNWGDDERTVELHEFLLEPVKRLNLRSRVHGVRYARHALDALRDAGIEYGNWLANFDAPQVFARFKVTVHVPRGPYVKALPGIPTIRVFEALACGIPLICAPWSDAEYLFSPGKDFLVAQDGEQMRRHLKLLVNESEARRRLAAHGHRTILARHTCAHRVDELMEIVAELQGEASSPPRTRSTPRKAQLV